MAANSISISVMFIILSTSFLLLFSNFQIVRAALNLDSIDELTENLNTEIEKIVSEAVNSSKNALNTSSVILSNGSNVSSSQIIISNNQSVSASAGEGSLILNQ